MKIKFSLQFLIFSLTSILIIATSVAMSIYSYSKANDMLPKEFESRADIIAKNFAYQAFEGIIVQDPYMLDLLCKGVLEEKNLVYVFVYDDNKNILYQLHNKAKKVTSALLSKGNSKFENLTLPINKTYTSNLLDVEREVQDRQNKESIVGYVRIGVSLADIIALKKKLVKNFLIILAAVLGFGLMASYMLVRTLTTPLQKFVDTMSRIILTGSLDEQVKNPSYLKEVDKIQHHFNDMIRMLASKTSQLSESEEKFRKISSSAQDAIVMMDNKGKVTFWNTAAESIFEYSAKEIIGRDCRSILAPEHLQKEFHKNFSDFKKTGRGNVVGKGIELQSKRKSGDTIDVEVSISSVKISGIWNAIAIIRDITQRKKIEAELENHRDNLEKLVEDRTKELEDTQKELLNKAVEAGRAQLSAMVLHNIGNAITPVSVNTEKLKRNRIKEINQYLLQCYDDLADHKDDLNNYITKDSRGIQVAEYMGSLIKDLEPQQHKVDTVVDKISAGIDYVSEILSLQRAYAPGQSEMKERTSLNLLMDDALKIQEGAILKRNIRLEKNFSSTSLTLSIEKNKLMQVLVNFIKNSCDAIDESNKIDETPEKKDHKIKITTFQEDNSIGVKISDTGGGIEPGQIEKIFEFGVSTKGSSGFGLYYCKSFVEANNGTLTIESDGVGLGATIIMEFEI